jgi:putative transposase
VFCAAGARVVRIPVRAPRANAVAQRWAGTVRRDCLHWLLILGQRHLEQVIREYAEHYNTARLHRALEFPAPLARGQPGRPTNRIPEVIRHDRLRELIHEYEPLAA